ncbi:kinase-like protein [Phlebopus sp. FC_14]|nr:kinase-like protein [Phlebopus sp. FC_14]
MASYSGTSSDDQSSSPIASPGSENMHRGRSRVRRPSNKFSEHHMRKRGYHTFMSSFGKVFHVEKRWKLVREMGSGAYGVVVSAADEISGETVAIKLVTRVFEKVQLAKRALREITLLRHFANHENITGMIDLDAVSPDFQDMYATCSPLAADLHQIIKSGQTLTNEHVQYFLYQILRGMKYIHSASVIHRDLKPGNLLVNSDCELKICDFGLSRGFNAIPDEHVSCHLTEYVATRWYRAPEIMLAFRKYLRTHTTVDVWSIGCIFAELLLGRPLFKGKDYVDQLNKIFDVLGTPEANVIDRIGSEKAQAYVRSLPVKESISLTKLLPVADLQALDLLEKMLSFDPMSRITVSDALAHPWLATYHEETDEPNCPTVFNRWREIEKLETLDEFREAIWKEIEDYRMEVRGLKSNEVPLARVVGPVLVSPSRSPVEWPTVANSKHSDSGSQQRVSSPVQEMETLVPPPTSDLRPTTPSDPVVTYARRSSFMQPNRQSAYSSPLAFTTQPPLPTAIDGLPASTNDIAFPCESYVIPARSRAASTTGGDVTVRKLLRTLSTVSIHESVEGRPGGLAVGKFTVGEESEADAPPSEMPKEFGAEKGEGGGER